MKPWLRPRYCCTNVSGGCRYAKADTVFADADFVRSKGVCCGVGGLGCGQRLMPGEPLDLRLRWSAAALAGAFGLAGIGWTLRTVVFPPPLAHVAFAMSATEATDSVGLLAIDVVRDADFERAVTVDYAVTDGSAKLGQDYNASRGQLAFGPGERRKSVPVTLLPDTTFQKEKRHFSLSLLNVQGQPSHVVQIMPRPVARSDNLLAEQSVRAASVVAKDIADLVVRQEVLDRLLSTSRDKAGEFREYRQALAAVNGNLSRARESYLQTLRDLQLQPPATVLNAMPKVVEEFARKGFVQQSQVVAEMEKHFRVLLNHGQPDMDRWAKELSRVVPRVDGGGKPSAAT